MEIWKFPLNIGRNSVYMPGGAEILTVAAQRDNLCIWAHVDPCSAKAQRLFVVEGTGNILHEECTPDRYIGTAHWTHFVLHAFETTK